jgi:hypothetical protein
VTGKILGYNPDEASGTIKSESGERYTFSIDDWKENTPPKKDMRVDFERDESGRAKEIFLERERSEEHSGIMLGLVSLGLTFFLGFIGTFISRVVISGQSFSSAIIPTLIHLLLSFTVLIPVFGWIVYLIVTVYYMVRNYQLVMKRIEGG